MSYRVFNKTKTKKINLKIFFLLGALFGALGITSLAIAEEYRDLHPWSMLFYRGFESRETLGQLIQGKFSYAHEDLYSIEIAKVLDPQNPLRRFVSPIIGSLELAGNATMRREDTQPNHPIFEINPYLIMRWTHFPWNAYLNTSLAAAEGVSYDTRVPEQEKNSSEDISRFLNYLMFEVTANLPKHPDWEMSLRIHHRSGCYGVYGAGNTGSSAVGLGLRYRF